MKALHKTKGQKPLIAILSSIITAALTAGLGGATALADTSTPPPLSSTTSDASSPYAVLGKVTSNPAELTIDKVYSQVGNSVQWSASGLAANTTLNLVWETYTGKWITQADHVIGPAYTIGNKTLMQVQTDAAGNASGQFKAPSGFGDTHMVGLVDNQGNVVAAGTVILSPVATMESTTKPEGQFFHIHIDGLGVGPYTSAYQVLYDNRLLGNVSGITTGGVADFAVRAEGGVGTHTLELLVAGLQTPYLNLAQSPYWYRPTYNFVVNVTPGHPVTTYDVLPTPSPSTGNHLSLSVSSGTVGQKFSLSGSGLTPDHQYSIVWNTMAGSRVTAAGYAAKQLDLGNVTTDSNGNFTKSMTAPDDLGGPAHTIQLLDGTNVAGDAAFRIYPSLVSSPQNVALGQQFNVNLHGVGWTEYDNTYAVTYDNGTIGYGCGFNSHGDVSLQLQASGTPGLHYIDLYPSVYKGQQVLPNLYGIPLLTYAQDHPGDGLPAFHIVFNVLPKGDIALNVNGHGSVLLNTLEHSGQTSVPLYSVITRLKAAGIQSNWDGHTWSITDSKAGHVASAGNEGNISVLVNHQELLRTTTTVGYIPGNKIETTYIPINSVNQVLKSLGIVSKLDGATWTWTSN